MSNSLSKKQESSGFSQRSFNALEKFITERNLDEKETLNSLQAWGIVSSNCVTDSDVSEFDCREAVAYLIREANE